MTDSAATPTRLPSLDGLRAISIAAVITSHILWHGDTGARALVRTALGRAGVQVFFVVSGFLITRLLIGEQASRGRISLARFVERRALRILPPYAVYLTCVIMLARLVGMPLSAADIAHAATFTMNVASDRSSWVLAHGWSLSTEEQFYLLWPALAAMFGWRRVHWLALVVMLVPLATVCATGVLPSIHRFPNGADGIAAGCVLALAWESHRAWLGRIVRSPLPFVALALVLVRIAIADSHAGTVLETLTGPAIALLVARVVMIPTDAAGALLNAPAVMWLGRLSYSLYLWQQLFTRPTLEREAIPFPINVGCALGCAVISYYLVERPLLEARARLRAWSVREDASSISASRWSGVGSLTPETPHAEMLDAATPGDAP